MLPREIWIIILKIKWWTARVDRLEKILKFPKRISPRDSNWFTFVLGDMVWNYSNFYGYNQYEHWYGRDVGHELEWN
jgi:hypothetical protein